MSKGPDGLKVLFYRFGDVAAPQQRRALLRDAIAEQLGVVPDLVDLRYSAAGAPHAIVAGQRLFLSAAHRAPYTLAAIANRAVGVDLEPLGAAQEAPWHVLSAGECRLLRNIEDAAARHLAFLELWTLKEAVVKAQGTGFADDPSSIEIALRGSDPPTIIQNGASLTPAFIHYGVLPACSDRLAWACVLL